METPAITATLRKPEDVPETVETLPFKKIRCSKLCSQSSNVNEELNHKEAEVPKTMETPAIPVNQKEPEEDPESMETSANPANQSEPEEVPETMETPAIPDNQSEAEEVAETVESPAISANQSEPEEVP